MQNAVPAQTSVWRQGDHDRQRKDHQQDLINPFNRDGTPSEEFKSAYPDESKEVYKFLPTDEELNRGERQ